MNLMENNFSQQKMKDKKTMRILIILIVIVFLISMGIMVAIYYLQQTEFKFLVNGAAYQKYDEDLFIFNNDKVYISIKDMAPLVNYSAYNGAYGSQEQYSEDTTKCYVEGANEVASFELNSNIIYKITTDGKGEYEYFEIDEPVMQINNKLYTTITGICRAYNISLSYNKGNNQISMYTLPELVKYYTVNQANSAISGNFNNQKALLYNLLVVSNTTTNSSSSGSTSSNNSVRYGVTTLDGTEIIGTKYKNIQFIESTQEFLVTTTEDKMGIITSIGTTKVQPQYDELKQIDKDLNLYLATNNNKQGVIEKNGKILIYLEYDKIGINADNYSINNIKNPYLLYNNCIPVYQNGKWGMYDKTGKLIIPIEYDNLGCIVKNSDINANSIVLIPEIKGIVVCKKYDEMTLYGILNYQGKKIVGMVLDSVYSVTNSGRQEYYMTNAGKALNVIEWVNKHMDIDEINAQ